MLSGGALFGIIFGSILFFMIVLLISKGADPSWTQGGKRRIKRGKRVKYLKK